MCVSTVKIVKSLLPRDVLFFFYVSPFFLHNWGSALARNFASVASEYSTLLFSDRFFEFQRFFTSLSERPGITVGGERARIEYN